MPFNEATVLFDPDTGETRTMRSRGRAITVVWFPDPDLLPLVLIGVTKVERVRGRIA